MVRTDEYETELRMNLVAIKRVDPYAKDIVDSSAHVAFYTFNSDENEWEKTDVEGAFFIYSRNAEPFYSIFINNRLNTKPLVEPITAQIQLQSQPPFLLYRNERSRIRGFWFSNILECDRHCHLIGRLIKECENTASKSAIGLIANQNGKPNIPSCNITNITNKSESNQQAQSQLTELNSSNNVQQLQHESSNATNVDIFSMLSKAQEVFDNSSTSFLPNNINVNSELNVMTPKLEGLIMQPPHLGQDGTPQSVMNFFAAAKQPSATEVPKFQRILSNPLHTVEHIEKQQRIATPIFQQEGKNSPLIIMAKPPSVALSKY